MKLRIQHPADTGSAFTHFQKTLEEHRFAVKQRRAESMVGTCAFTTKKNNNDPLRSAAPISLTERNKGLELDAAFTNARRTRLFFVAFPLALGLLIAIVLGVVFGRDADLRVMILPAVVFPILIVAGVAVTGMAGTAFQHQRAVAAIEDLARQLAIASDGTFSGSVEGQRDAGVGGPLLISTALLLIGVVVTLLVIPGGMGRMFDDSNRLSLPEEQTVHLAEAGTYTIFYEYRTKVDGRAHNTPKSWTPTRAELRASDGETIQADLIPSYTKYDLPSRSGHSIARFTAARVGDFALNMSGIPEGETRMVSVTHFTVSDVLWTVGRWFLVVSMGIAWIFNLLRVVKRSRTPAAV